VKLTVGFDKLLPTDDTFDPAYVKKKSVILYSTIERQKGFFFSPYTNHKSRAFELRKVGKYVLFY